jgi:hypothetical protein
LSQETYRGAPVRELPRRNRTFPKGRVCAAEGCGTVLSIYNRSEFCWQHEPVREYIPRGRRTRRAA